ncbi:MAG: hypothetical protein LBE36_14265 [Flavobacteriaceae bacterium]|jgi:hypothetical protein|nr:hypothetical protein [Flavobacteriaceae bacterium]
MFNTRQEYIDLLRQLEKEVYPKLKKCWGINPWAIVRTRVSFYFHRVYTKRINDSAKKQCERSVLGGKIKKQDLWMLFKSFCHLILTYPKLKGKLKNKTMLIAFTTHIENGHNKLLEPYQKVLTEKKEEYEVIYLDKMNTADNELNIFFRRLSISVLNLLKIVNKINKQQCKNNKRNADLIKDFFQTHTKLDAEYISSVVDQGIGDNHYYYVYYYYLLKILLPKKVWFVVYYDYRVMPLIRAAKRLKINTCEYQHSAISNNHFAYMKWNNIDYYSDSFPETFQVWSEADKELIERNFSDKKYKPEITVTGNYYLNQQKIKFKTDKSKGNVLICLQGIWIPTFIEDAIADSENIKWYFRLHPRYPHDKPKLQKFQERYPHKIEIEKANSLPLFELFGEVSSLITFFSTAAIEGREFGLKVIIIGAEGYSSYKNYIERGDFYYIENKSDLLKIIEK